MLKNKPTRILALDFGFVRIGVAVSDPQKIIATPFDNITGSRDVAVAAAHVAIFLKEIQEKKGCVISQIVVGLPLLLNGGDSERTQAVRAFVQALAEKVDVPIELFDERLTSVQAERSLISGDVRRDKRKQLVDRVSAVILLQTYLDKEAYKKQHSE